jgi:hypothetical protein
MMKNKLTYFLAMLSISLGSCIKEIDFETETFESALLVEARITNDEKNHEIKLSRTYRFEDDGPDPETNAIVKIQVPMKDHIILYLPLVVIALG